MLHIFTSRKNRALFWAVVIFILAIILALLLFGGPLVAFLKHPSRIKPFLLGFGSFAPLMFISIQALQVVLAPVPGEFLGFAAGYVFGAFNGLVYALIGMFIGSLTAFFVARKFGRPFVERAFTKTAIRKFDYVAGKQGPAALFLIFLLPALPDDILCFVAGLTKIPLKQFALIVFFGRLPGFVVLAMAGDGIARGHLVVVFVLFALLAAFSFFMYLYRDYVHRFLKSAGNGNGHAKN
ncbi:TPA: TVP38/TMEM64 family protein [Candidatus Woesearchaeota archaeon]|nr:MAG: hypothetical protein QT04_C0002G0004 [archaeon GW2011_AR11]HIH05352.1 TVP38/TMEM64 family protein [Candidatus Woesearchaeota archaeon]HIH91758.1 TVP38/TMEM64 family protein [Candidatus Woesearchaeota archaeon]